MQRKVNKQGGVWLVFRLEDVDGGCECIAWASTYEQYRELLVEDAIVKVKGRLCESRRADGTLVDDYGGTMVKVVWVAVRFGTDTATFHKGEWHTSLEAAQDRVQEMKAAKLKSLRKQVAKLEATCVSSMPIDVRTALAGTPETEE